jgi:hypothetical protein
MVKNWKTASVSEVTEALCSDGDTMVPPLWRGVEVPQKIIHRIMLIKHIIQQFRFWVLSKNNWKQGLKQIFVYQFHTSITHNSPKVLKIQMPIGGWMEKQNVVYAYDKKLFSLKKGM